MDKSKTDENSDDENEPIVMTLKNANLLAQLPLDCLHTEYPNKLGQVLTSEMDLATPKELHPAFYGCFDWHSSVHGHWALVKLLKEFPDLAKANRIRALLQEDISKENIAREVAYFKKTSNNGFERTYGWAWLLKLAEELYSWQDPIALGLKENLQPLTDVIVAHFESFLPKLTEPLRVGEHENTAFALVFVYDYAKTVGNKKLLGLVKDRAKDFYLEDKNCPIAYEPSGFDFLSPCLEEVDIMSRVLSKKAFLSWLNGFMPQLMDSKFELAPGKVSDRADGKLVHLDGLNFSRAWVFYDLANKYHSLSHLVHLGDAQFRHSFQHIVDGDSYMGSHWLGTFAIYALSRR